MLLPLAEIFTQLTEKLSALAGRVVEAVRADTGPDTETQVVRRQAALRLRGQESAITIDVNNVQTVGSAFYASYKTCISMIPRTGCWNGSV